MKKLQSKPQNKASVLTDKSYKLMSENELKIAQKFASIIMYLVYAFLHVIVMVIIMNMNFYVIFFIVIGATLGFMATSQDYCAKK
jgi:hypothetical protein